MRGVKLPIKLMTRHVRPAERDYNETITHALRLARQTVWVQSLNGWNVHIILMKLYATTFHKLERPRPCLECKHIMQDKFYNYNYADLSTHNTYNKCALAHLNAIKM